MRASPSHASPALLATDPERMAPQHSMSAHAHSRAYIRVQQTRVCITVCVCVCVRGDRTHKAPGTYPESPRMMTFSSTFLRAAIVKRQVPACTRPPPTTA